jgi:hypothetical protein
MTSKLIAAAAALLLALVIPSVSGAHTEPPPPKHGCLTAKRVSTHSPSHCFVVARLVALRSL